MLRTGAEHLNICRKINEYFLQGAEHLNLLRTILRCSAPYETWFGRFYKYYGALHLCVTSVIELKVEKPHRGDILVALRETQGFREQNFV